MSGGPLASGPQLALSGLSTSVFPYVWVPPSPHQPCTCSYPHPTEAFSFPLAFVSNSLVTRPLQQTAASCCCLRRPRLAEKMLEGKGWAPRVVTEQEELIEQLQSLTATQSALRKHLSLGG